MQGLEMKRLLGGVAKSLVTTIIFFTLAEIALRGAYFARNAVVSRVPLPYALGDEYGPIPPWLDRLLILVPDNTLIWRNLPNVRRTYVDIFSPVHTEQDRIALLRRFTPTLPSEFRANPTWTISLNSYGYRTSEYTVSKPPGTIRIACIGDSWTFGMNVDQDKTYPSRLVAWLRRLHPDSRVEVLNFGVLGYSSFQGLQLLKTRVLELKPDILAIGFGMNDSEVAGYRDKDMISDQPPHVSDRIKETATDLEFYKLLNYLALELRFHPKSIGDYVKEDADAKSDPIDYDTIERWTRVSPHDYDANIREMIRLQTSRGGAVVLVDNELWEGSPYRPVLKTIAAEAHVPLVDSLQIVEDAKTQVAHQLEARLDLVESRAAFPVPAASAPMTTVVFRVAHGDFPVPTAMSIVGADARLGNLTPNAVLMHDDGADGDQRAGDGVWSYAATFPAGTRLSYVYTNSGARGTWEGLDVPSIRHVTVPASADGRPVLLPIETFGHLYLQADNWHTDATGYDLIAQAVALRIEDCGLRIY
jgi:lysophospholipase L1-like esterase